MNDAAQGSHFRASLPAPFDKLSALIPDDSGCDAPNMKIPGTYISMAAFGNQKGTTFTSTAGISFWMIAKYTKGTKPTADAEHRTDGDADDRTDAEAGPQSSSTPGRIRPRKRSRPVARFCL